MNATRSTILILAVIVTATAASAYLRSTEISSQGDGALASGGAATSSEAMSSVKRPLAWATDAFATGSNVAQSSVAFDTSRRCYFAKNKAAALRSVNKSCSTIPQTGTSDAEASSCAAAVEKNTATLQQMNQELAGCSADQGSAKAFFEATKIAAAQGNVDAQVCYVQGQFQSGGIELPYSQAEVDDYVQAAPRYVNNGLARGDWRIVSLLARHGYGDNFDPLQLLTHGNVYRQFVMNRLLQLGAEGAYAQQLEESIQADYLSPGTTSAPLLTQQQVSDGLKDAQALYRRSFDRQPRLKASPQICAPR